MVAVAGKAIVERHLGAVPRYSYHVGISAGGKQGLTAAQRHSWDFDGILAMEPSSPTATGVVVHWNALVTHDADGNPLFQTADLRVLHQGAIDACDADDGLEDGVIGGDPGPAGSTRACSSAAPDRTPDAFLRRRWRRRGRSTRGR